MRPRRGPAAWSLPEAAAAVAAAALSLAAGAPAQAQSAGEWASSAQLWRDTCRYCHDGRLAPELRGAALPAQAVVSAVRRGPKAMPAFAPSEISDQELERLAEWIRAQPKPAAPQIHRPDRLPRHGTRERSR